MYGMCRETVMHKLPARRKPRPGQFADARGQHPTSLYCECTYTNSLGAAGGKKIHWRELAQHRRGQETSGRKSPTIGCYDTSTYGLPVGVLGKGAFCPSKP